MWHIICFIINKDYIIGDAMKDIYKSGLIVLSAVGAFFIGMKLPKTLAKLKIFISEKELCPSKKHIEPSKINFC